MNMLLMVIALIVLLVILYNKYSDLKDENYLLKEEIKKLQASVEKKVIKFCGKCGFDLKERPNAKFCPKCGNDLYNTGRPTVANTNVQYPTKKETKKIEKTKMSDVDKRNLAILVVGSFLIILAAVFLLTSTWAVSHSLFKTAVILALLVAFFGLSYVADKKYNLKQASKAFFYIGCAYLPAALMSFAVFGLLGDAFSEGILFKAYTAIVCILTSAVYYYYYKKDDDVYLSVASIIFQLFSIISFVNMITEKNIYLYLGLFLCSVAMAIGYYYKKLIYSEKVTKYTIGIVSIFSSIIFFVYYATLFFNEGIEYLYYLILLAIFMLGDIFLIRKILKNDMLFKAYYPTTVLLMCLGFINVFTPKPDVLVQIIIILGFLCTLVIDYIDCKTEINVYNYILTLFGMGYMYIESLLNPEFMLDSYLILFIVALFSYLDYSFSKNKTYMGMAVIIAELALTDLSVVLINDMAIGLIAAFALYAISYLSFMKEFKDIFKYVGLSMMPILSLLICIRGEFMWVAFATLAITSGLLFFIEAKENNEKDVLLYPYINLSLGILGYILDPSKGILFNILLLSSVWLNLLIGALYNKDRKIFNMGYQIITYFIAMTMLQSISLFENIMLIGITVMFVITVIKNKDNYEWLYFPLLLVLVPMFRLDYSLIAPFIEILVGLGIIMYFVVKPKYKNLRLLPYIYAVALMLLNSYLDVDIINNYVFFGLLALLSTGLIFSDNKHMMDKIILELSILALYSNILNDLNLTNPLWMLFAYLVATMIFTRIILRNINENTVNLFEYVLLALVNLVMLFSHLSNTEGLVFVGFLVVLMFIGYIYKYEPAFRMSIAFIVIDILLLVADYLITLPGWLYLLIIGIVIVMFAVYNENKNKNKKE